MPQLASALTAATRTHIAFNCVTDAEFEAICREDDIPDEFVEILASMYRAVDHVEFDKVTDHVELLSGAPAESAESYLRRAIGGPGR